MATMKETFEWQEKARRFPKRGRRTLEELSCRPWTEKVWQQVEM